MDRLVDEYGKINFGLIHDPVSRINHEDFCLETSSGRPRSRLMKKMLFKQFSFVGIDCPEMMVGAAVVDLKYAANAFFYVFDKATKSFTETKRTTLPHAAAITPCPEQGQNAFFHTRGLRVSITQGRVFAECKNAGLDAALIRDNTLPLRICTRTGYRGWTYTQKTAPIPVAGSLRINGKTLLLSADTAMAITDWSAGYFRRETFWNWAAASSVLPDGRRFGMNFSCGVNETEATENVFWVGKNRVKVDNVKFRFVPQEGDEPWRISSADGKVALTFSPVSSRREHLSAWIVMSRFTQFLGYFSGRLSDPSTGDVILERCPGWAEDHFAKW